MISGSESSRTATARLPTLATLTHTQAPPVLRDRGPFVATILDGVDARLRSWGIEPPDAYGHVETAGTTQTYAGTLTLY